MELIKAHQDAIDTFMTNLYDDCLQVISLKESKEYNQAIRQRVNYWLKANF